MPNSFSDSRDDHLKRSGAFLREAFNRTNDDLLYRSAISDAVEAIKHSFQAYLWQRAAEVAADERRQRWQMTAVDAKMPDLVATVQEAGLSLSRNRGDDVLRLNRNRNRHTHDAPRGGTRITATEALDAVRLAQDVRNAVVVALGGKPETMLPPGGSVGANPPAGARPSSPPPPTPTPTPAPSPAKPADVAPAPPVTPAPADDEDDDDGGDERPARRRGRSGWLVALAAVLALLVGLSGGVVLGYPLGQGNVPGWLAWLPTGLLPTAASPTPTAAATATPATLPTGPFVVGVLLVTPSACGVSPATLTLRDTGAAPVSWSAGSPDSVGAAFALAPTALARPTLAGRLAPGASVTLTITGVAPGAGRVVIVADGGTLAVPLGVC